MNRPGFLRQVINDPERIQRRLEQHTEIGAFDNITANSRVGGSTAKDRSAGSRLQPQQISHLVDRLAALASYDQQTIWGYDTGTNGFPAQLWPNGTRTDPETCVRIWEVG